MAYVKTTALTVSLLVFSLTGPLEAADPELPNARKGRPYLAYLCTNEDGSNCRVACDNLMSKDGVRIHLIETMERGGILTTTWSQGEQYPNVLTVSANMPNCSFRAMRPVSEQEARKVIDALYLKLPDPVWPK